MALDFTLESSSSITLPDSDGVTMFIDADTKKVGFKSANGSRRYFAEAQVARRIEATSTNIDFSAATIQYLNLTASDYMTMSNPVLNRRITLEVSSSNFSSPLFDTSTFIKLNDATTGVGSKTYIQFHCISVDIPLFTYKIIKRKLET